MKSSTMWWVIGGVLVLVVVSVAIMSGGSAEPSITVTATTASTTATTTNKDVGPKVTVETRADQSVFQVAASISGSSQFAALLASTGVGVSVGTTTYTVFVPTDGAFNRTPKGYLAGLNAAGKKRLVQYHIISGRAIDSDAMELGRMEAISKDVLNLSVGDDKYPNVNNSNIIRQYKARNGIVYVIDAVLLPPSK